MDAGLLMGLAEGIRSGVTSYQDAQRLAMQRKQAEQQAKMQAAMHGFDIGEGGELIPTEYAQKEQAGKLAGLTELEEERDPESERSRRAQGLLESFATPEQRGLLGKQHYSAKELKEFGMPMQKAASAAELRINSPIAQERLDLQKQRQAQGIGGRIQGDKILTAGNQAIGAADRGKSILTKTDSPVTYQDAQIAATDLARIIQGGNPAQGSIHEAQYNTAYGKVQRLMQEFTGKPQDALPGELKTQLIKSFDELKTVQKKINSERAEHLSKMYGAASSKNPYAKQTLEEVSKEYAPQAPALDPADQEAVEWLKANPNDPHAPEVAKKLKAKGVL